jgi:hypothetical protein
MTLPLLQLPWPSQARSEAPGRLESRVHGARQANQRPIACIGEGEIRRVPANHKTSAPRNMDDKAARQAALAFEIELERRDRARWIYGGLLNLPSVASGQFLRFDQSEFVRGNNASLK